MNRSLRGATLGLLALAPFAYLACSDDNSTNPATIVTIDASLPPLPTSDATAPDDGGADADADAAPPPTTATVLAVSAKGTVEAGIKVVFYDATGTALGIETTDADGKATHTMTSGGAITAVFGSDTDHELVTILGVEPGDSLTALDPVRVSNTTFDVTPPPIANVSLPTGTAFLRVLVGNCRSGDLPPTGGTTYTDFTYCEGGSDAPPVVLAALNGQRAILATTVTSSVPLVNGGTTNVSFAGPWTAPSGTDTTTVTNMSGVSAPNIGYHTTATTHTSGTGAQSVSTSAFNAPVDGGITNSFPRLFPGTTFVQHQFAFLDEQNSEPGALLTRAIATRGAPGDATIDFGTSLPAITAVTVTGTTSPNVTWTSAAPLTAAKGLVAQLYWSDREVESNGAWTIIAPPTAASIAPPALPTELSASGPLASVTYGSLPLVAAVDATFLPTYATVRASGALMAPSQSLRNGAFNVPVPALPVDGTLKLTAYGVNGGG